MCYAAGSIDHAVSPCPMCKVFPHARCPHVRETCRNRALHPRMDVLYIKNAEVERFNGCGYCKWARSDPPPPQDFLRYNNPGWPGCCRAPFPTEYRSIPATDWRAVSIVHNIPTPPDIQVMLDTFQSRGPPLPQFPPSPASTFSRASPRPGNDRKNSGGSSPSSKASTLSKAAGSSISAKLRSGGSPQAPVATLSRTSSGTAISAPTDNVNDRERRHRNGVDTPERTVYSSNSSPNRKNIDLDSSSSIPIRPSSLRRPTITPATTSVSVSKVVANNPPSATGYNQGSVRRRSSVTRPEKRDLPITSAMNTSSPPRSAPPPRPNSLVIPPTIPRSEDDNISSASSSSGSSDGMGSLSDNTVTSDGGFTDYLSDESEAELQRQAEAKAALVAMNMAEELEFKAARLQLAHVDLRPPKSWNPTNITNTTPSRFPTKEMVGSPLGTGTLSRVGQARS